MPATARRAPLDGLRGVAVAAVLVYHFGGGASSALPGGFLGVDLFFVLSGYLITGNLVRTYHRHGRVDLVAFWAQRVRRLFPALALVLLFVLAATWYAAPPESWSARRADAWWSLAYLSNWHFVGVGEDYFAGYVDASPLRHTWSLAIEEQFYVLWPLVVAVVLWAGARRRRPPADGERVPPGAGLGALAALSMLVTAGSAAALAATFEPGFVSRAYYGTDGRVQQLLVGAVVAILLQRSGSSRTGRTPQVGRARWLRRSAPVLVVLVVAAFALGSDRSPLYYRGGALLFAVLVAALMLAVEWWPTTGPARAMSWSPLVALGRISYGVYLWHWPLMQVLPDPHGSGALRFWAVQLLRVGLTLAVSAASYRWVEQPILQRRGVWLRRSDRRAFLAAAAMAALLVAVAWSATALPGTVQRQLADRADRGCPRESVVDLTSCVQHRGSGGAPVVLLLGDSTARALVPGLVEQAAARDLTLVQAAWQRCSPTGLLVVPNGMTAPDAPARTCHAQARDRIRQALARYRPQLVLVSDFWSHHQGVLVDGRLAAPGSAAHARALRSGYASLVADVDAAGARVALVDLPPRGASLGPQVADGRPAGRARTPYGGAFVPSFNAMLQVVAGGSGGAAVTVSVSDLLCPGGDCSAVQAGQVVRTDGVHVTAAQSRRLAPALLDRAWSAVGRPRAADG